MNKRYFLKLLPALALIPFFKKKEEPVSYFPIRYNSTKELTGLYESGIKLGPVFGNHRGGIILVEDPRFPVLKGAKNAVS